MEASCVWVGEWDMSLGHDADGKNTMSHTSVPAPCPPYTGRSPPGFDSSSCSSSMVIQPWWWHNSVYNSDRHPGKCSFCCWEQMSSFFCHWKRVLLDMSVSGKNNEVISLLSSWRPQLLFLHYHCCSPLFAFGASGASGARGALKRLQGDGGGKRKDCPGHTNG